MTATVVSHVGAIGFVGMVVPHVARYWTGGRHRVLLPVAAWLGALFLMLADVLSRSLALSQALPVGVMTALVGATAVCHIGLSHGAHITWWSISLR